MFKFCMNFIKQYRIKLLIYIFINIIIGVVGITIPIITGRIIDNAVYEKDINFLLNYIVIFLILNLFSPKFNRRCYIKSDWIISCNCICYKDELYSCSITCNNCHTICFRLKNF